MDILTESDLRIAYFVRGEREFTVDPDTVITEESRIFADHHGMQIRCRKAGCITRSPAAARPGQAKPEHMTNLTPSELVPKNDLRITFRGKLDTFQAQLLQVIAKCHKYNSPQLAAYLGEAVGLLRKVMAADVKNEPLPPWTFIGLTPDELREHSHHPEKYYNRKHQPPEADLGYAALELNLLRAQSREVEMAFSQAFIEGNTVKRGDIATLLNRLSSGLYILYCRAAGGEFDCAQTAPGGGTACCSRAAGAGGSAVPVRALPIPLEVSAHHVHLTREDVETLFGKGHCLTPKRDLSQPGQFLSEERVTLRGPKGEIRNVAVLGPERPATQTELSISDACVLGIAPPIRLSGDLSGAADVTIIGPSGTLEAKGSAIVARSHIHLTEEDAKEMGLRNNQLVSVEVKGDRPVTFRDVVVRVSQKSRKFMHIDFDEANAAHIGKGVSGLILP